jgi:putative endonuclease
MAFYTYILFSEKTNRYYIGSTEDIDKRVEKHNAGATPSTKPGRPWKVVYREEFYSKSEAIKREIYLKRMKSRVFIELLINKGSAG